MDNYNNLRNSLNQANIGFKPPPVLDDQINYTEEALKGGIEGIGAQLTGGALLSSLKGLRKSNAKVLRDSGIADSDLDDIEASAAQGDLSGVASNATRAILGGINRQLGNAGNALKGAVRDLGNRAKGAQSYASRARPSSDDNLLDTEDLFKQATEFRPPEGTTNPFSFDFDPLPVSPLQGGLRGDSTIARALRQRPLASEDEVQRPLGPEPSDNPPVSKPPSTEVPNVAADSEKLGSEVLDNTSDVVSKGEKVLGDLKKVDKAATAGDFDPLDILGQAALGLTTIGLGLLIHPHHVTNVAPKADLPTNYSAQLY